ncbi:MAG: flagellar basal body rod protein FlgC [Dongiaceae bacterium]
MDLNAAMQVSGSGLKAQSQRLRIIAENLANAESLPPAPGKAPYQRKVVTFKNTLDKELGANTVKMDKTRRDTSPFQMRYEPGHPSADANGYVSLPNVNPMIEMADMREAQRSYEANLSMLESSRNMLRSTLDLLR